VKYIITGWYSYNDYPKEEEKWKHLPQK
jgi:hypothetical protein